MCQNAEKTVASLLAAIEPGLVSLLTATGLADTPQGKAAIDAFNVAVQAARSWVPGTASQDVIQVINAFTAVFSVLPFPPAVQTLVDIISAGIVTVIGVLAGNSPAPAVPAVVEGAGSPEEVQHAHAFETAKQTEATVTKLVPGFKRSLFHSAAHQYKQTWDSAVDKVATADTKYAVLKQA